MKTVAIFGDKPSAATGMAIVLRNIANELTRKYRVIYFGRFGCEKEFASDTTLHGNDYFEYVPTQGGVWDRELVVRILNHYKDIDIVFCEDDGFSANGIVKAVEFHEKPFHFLTPIDSLPVHRNIIEDVFLNCSKIYIPNSSYKMFNGIKRSKVHNNVPFHGPILKSVYLPHGCDTRVFMPMKIDRSDKFTFLWSGRLETRKNPYAFIMAANKLNNKIDANFLMRSDWTTPYARRFVDYIKKKNLPFTLEQMSDMPHEEMVKVYNKADVNVCTAKAGGFEMSTIEAGACRVPSLVTDWTFKNENIVNEKSGILIPISDFSHPSPPIPTEYRTSDIAQDRIWGDISVDKLAAYMVYCYNTPAHVKQMGNYAREYVKNTYKWSSVVKTLGEEFES